MRAAGGTARDPTLPRGVLGPGHFVRSLHAAGGRVRTAAVPRAHRCESERQHIPIRPINIPINMSRRLLAAPLLFQLLGKRGLMATERLMGMLLVIISVQMFFDGFDKFIDG